MEGMINDYDVFFRGIYCKSVLYPLNKGQKVVAAVVLTVVNIVSLSLDLVIDPVQ